MIPYNTAIVLAGCAMLGLAAGVVGTFALLRGRALVADAVGHAALPGVALAALLVGTLGGDSRSLPPLLAGAAAAGVAGVLAVQALTRTRRIREDAAIAIVLSSFYALGVALLSWLQTVPGAAQAGLSKFILGQAAAMRAEDATIAATVAALCLVLVLLAFQRLRAACFDPDFARVQGLAVGRVDLLLLGLIVTVCVAGLQAVGADPGGRAAGAAGGDRPPPHPPPAAHAGARRGDRRGGRGGRAPGSPPSGRRCRPGAAVVLAGAAAFTLALLLAPERGLLARGATHLRRRLGADTEHFLRAAWEAQEAAGAGPGTAGDRWAPIEAVAAARGWTARQGAAAGALAGAARPGRAGGGPCPPHAARRDRRPPRGARPPRRGAPPAGGRRADIASADRLADLVEHGLPPEMAAKLLPEPSSLPASPHLLGGRR
jgi:manganese/zinc/iron transport system permease protein